MGEKVLPDSPELPLDESHLKALIQDAIRAAIRDLRGTDVTGGRFPVTRLTEGEWVDQELPAPSYRKKAIWYRISEVWKSKEADDLTNYLWSRGALKKTLWIDDDKWDADKSKESWQRFVWGDLVHAPLLTFLPLAAEEDLVKTGEYQPWRLSEKTIEDAAADLADEVCNRRRTIMATCPAVGLELSGASEVEAEPGVILQPWPFESDERRIFFTHYGNEYLRNDISTWTGHAAIKLRRRVEGLSLEHAAESVGSSLDSLKWALMIAAKTDRPFEEGPVIVRGLSGWRGLTLRRGDTLLVGHRSMSSVKVTPDVALRLPNLLRDLSMARPASGEIGSALWLLGRACNAFLPRDALLDAAIGLEMLLVPNPGEATYRFTLHGLALIEDERADQLESDLREIYSKRGKAAHGDPTEAGAFDRIAPRARLLLAKTINSVVRLMNSGELDTVATRGDIGEAVQRLVKKKVTVNR
jgi:hypothetical protein